MATGDIFTIRGLDMVELKVKNGRIDSRMEDGIDLLVVPSYWQDSAGPNVPGFNGHEFGLPRLVQVRVPMGMSGFIAFDGSKSFRIGARVTSHYDPLLEQLSKLPPDSLKPSPVMIVLGTITAALLVFHGLIKKIIRKMPVF